MVTWGFGGVDSLQYIVYTIMVGWGRDNWGGGGEVVDKWFIQSNTLTMIINK